MSAGPEQTEPAAPAPPTPPTQQQPAEPPVGPSMAAFGGHDSCPNCGARMAQDQRYCLNCGHRRGEPRLPFMDAVVFMESMSAPAGAGGAPPPPPPKAGESSSRWNANAALIAGVATLVLAIGVGFLIGRSGNDNSSPSSAAPQVIKVEGGTGGGGGEEAVTPEETTGGEAESSSGAKKGGSESGGKQKKTSGEEESKEEKAVAEEKTKETLHAEGPLPETGTQVGESCKPGTPGCQGEEFTGNFFGE